MRQFLKLTGLVMFNSVIITLLYFLIHSWLIRELGKKKNYKIHLYEIDKIEIVLNKIIRNFKIKNTEMLVIFSPYNFCNPPHS